MSWYTVIHLGVSCSPAPRSSVMCLNKYNLKSDAVIFTMVTKIEQERDPLFLVPHFTGGLISHLNVVFLVMKRLKTYYLRNTHNVRAVRVEKKSK